MLKISEISLVLRTREITDIFNTFDEIYLPLFGIHLKNVNILYVPLNKRPKWPESLPDNP